MNAALEFHDSCVQSIHTDDHGDVSLNFSEAYIHKSVGQPGVDSGTGHFQAATVSFSQAHLGGDLAECVGPLSDGTILVNGHSLSLLPVPYSFRGPVVAANFTFQNGAFVKIDASAVECCVFGPSEFVETFHP
jgi:hypothetical protein